MKLLAAALETSVVALVRLVMEELVARRAWEARTLGSRRSVRSIAGDDDMALYLTSRGSQCWSCTTAAMQYMMGSSSLLSHIYTSPCSWAPFRGAGKGFDLHSVARSPGESWVPQAQVVDQPSRHMGHMGLRLMTSGELDQ